MMHMDSAGRPGEENAFGMQEQSLMEEAANMA